MSERKDKRVIFRVSKDEYVRLKRLCVATNTRSVSDMVRAAVQFWMKHGGGDNEAGLQNRLRELNTQVAALAAEVERLARSAAAK
jgi:hypothetical protein